MTTKNCANGPKLVLKDLCEKSFVRNDRLPRKCIENRTENINIYGKGKGFNCDMIHVTFFFHRALKKKGNTPKYGLIFHSSFIGRAGVKNKGRISRYLANKCSIASRIDCFAGMLIMNLNFVCIINVLVFQSHNGRSVADTIFL